MKKDASLLVFLVVIALASVLTTPTEPVEPPPEEEIRIGDVAKIDEVKDAQAPDGVYVKTKGGWAYHPGEKLPKAEIAAFMNSQLAESGAGLALIVLIFVLILNLKSGKKRKAAARDMKRISGVSQAEFQMLIRKLSGMEQILQNLTPDNAEKAKGRKGKWWV